MIFLLVNKKRVKFDSFFILNKSNSNIGNIIYTTMAYVYKHIRLDINEVFYIGIGSTKFRANSKKYRNKYWHNIVSKHGLICEIIEDDLTWEQACDREKYWIAFYGRENLCNMTDGGEGTYGREATDDTKNRISKSHMGKKLSEEHKNKIREGNIGKSKPKPDGFGDKVRSIVLGKKRSEESKIKQSISTKQSLSKIKEKLSEKSKGIKNSNAVRYTLLNTLSNIIVEIDGYKAVLDYFNEITNSDKKDAMFLIKKIKEDKIESLKLISSVKVNSK
jgi:hypothetical protein